MKAIRIGPKKPRKKAVLIPKKNAKTLTRADFEAIYAAVRKTLKKNAAYIKRTSPRRGADLMRSWFR